MTPEVTGLIQAQSERLPKDGILYDITTIFQQIFATNGLTERFALVDEAEVALWLLTEEDYRHFLSRIARFCRPS